MLKEMVEEVEKVLKDYPELDMETAIAIVKEAYEKEGEI